MSFFPVTNSTLSADHVGIFLQEKYGLSKDTSCRLLKNGINDTYLVSDRDKKYIFRLYSLGWRNEKEILEEIRLLSLLKDHNLPISYPINDLRSAYIQELSAPEGNRFGVLFSYAVGQKLLNLPLELHFKIGEIMAQIHRVTHDLKLERISYTPEVLFIDSFEHLKRFLPAGTDEMKYMKSIQDFLDRQFKLIETSEIRYGAVHLDIWVDNLNVKNETEVTIFDFDFCGNGWLCLDLAYYILQLHSTEKDESECRLKTESFLNGYESVIGLSDEEKRILPMFGISLYFFYLGVQCQRFENWSNSFLNEVYLKRFVNLLVKEYFENNIAADELMLKENN